MKNCIVIILIISLLNLIGCYYQEQLTPSSYDFDEHSDIQVSTSDTTYKLMGDDYHFANDTLFATIPKKIDRRTTHKLKVNIPVSEIKSVQVERTDTFASIATAFGVITVVLAIVIVVGLSESGWL
ncbi:MAG: hypothetical protein DAHOPDDO_02940 [Ignavibacteriaceae bacterium]|nr:hypothetical protein [Ignavibacteriaceae bacterium]